MEKPQEILSEFYDLFYAHNQIKKSLGATLYKNEELLFSINKLYSYIGKVITGYADAYIESIDHNGLKYDAFLMQQVEETFIKNIDYIINVKFFIVVIIRMGNWEIKLDNKYDILKRIIYGMILKFYSEKSDSIRASIPYTLEKVLNLLEENGESLSDDIIPVLDKVSSIYIEDDNSYFEHIYKVVNILQDIKTEKSFLLLKQLQNHVSDNVSKLATNTIKTFPSWS